MATSFDDFMYGLLNSGQARHPGVGGGMPQTVNPLAAAGQGAMPSPAPVQPQTMQPVSAGYQMPQRAPQGNAGGFLSGLGNVVQGLLAPQSGGRNATVNWLQSQGMDPGTATLLAGNKPALQKFLIDRAQGADPMEALKQEKLGLEIEQMRNPHEDLINAGKGRLYDPNTGKWIVAPGVAAPNEAPTVKSFYDDKGQEYKAQWNPATREWQQVGGSKAPSNGVSVTSPDGTTIRVGGKLTEGQSKDVVFYTRGADANKRLDQMGGFLTSWAQEHAGDLPLGIGNYIRSPEFRQAKQAADSFLTALLRKDTGAAITPREFEIYGPMFLPVPGDDPATMQQKQRAREVALLAIRSGLGTADAIAAANRTILGLPDDQLPLTAMPQGRPMSPQERRQERAGNGLGAPSIGTVEDGYRFRGGDPGDPNSWERVQ